MAKGVSYSGFAGSGVSIREEPLDSMLPVAYFKELKLKSLDLRPHLRDSLWSIG